METRVSQLSAEYSYSGDSLLADMKKYQNDVLVSESRLFLDGFLPLQERDGNNGIVSEYVWGLNMGGGIGGLLDLKQGGQNYEYLYDGKGNVTALLNGSQTVAATYTYDAFGNLMSETGSLSQPFQFSTKHYDEETGLSYFGYRFYLPALGRWMTRDPIGYAGGLNLYGYVGNDPVNWVDPYGLMLGEMGPIGGLSFEGLGAELSANWIASGTWLNSAADFSAGFGDFITGGITSQIRDLGGLNDFVDPCSGAYSGGQWAGLGWDLAFTAAFGAAAAGADITLFAPATPVAATTAPLIGRVEWHHIIPKYLGGPANGLRVSLDAGYHQLITNEFRRLWPYGQPVPDAERVQEIIMDVYQKYPLP